MTNGIYEAFVEFGLCKEARTLSKTVILPSGKTEVVPAIGHYIALADRMPIHYIGEENWQEIPGLSFSSPSVQQMFLKNEAHGKIQTYLFRLRTDQRQALSQKIDKILNPKIKKCNQNNSQ